jgi:hypothetical protein
LQEDQKQKANLEAIATAKLTAAVMRIGQQWGGSPPPDDFGLLLPFPPERETFTDGKTLPIAKDTAQCFFRLIAAGQLPRWAAGDLVRYTVQWKKLAG